MSDELPVKLEAEAEYDKSEQGRAVICTCYDYGCAAEHEYTDADFYQHYDAQLGMLDAFICKSCGLTNSK